MSGECVLEFKGVQVVHSQRPELALFDQVDWRVEEGDFWVIGSTQGSGKSAFLETAAGRNRPPKGEVRLFGEPIFDVTNRPAEELRRRAALVFDQDGRVFHHLTIAENIALPLCYHQHLDWNAALAKLEPLIEAAELRPLLVLGAGRVSRGWAWRTALVRALALQPDLLLLDNPMAGLDREHSRWCRAFVNRLMTDGAGPVKPRAAILICDDLRPWVGVGRQFATASAGKWAELGDRRSVLESTEPSVRALLERDY